MSLIKQAFINCKKEKRPALLTFTVAGDNNVFFTGLFTD